MSKKSDEISQMEWNNRNTPGYNVIQELANREARTTAAYHRGERTYHDNEDPNFVKDSNGNWAARGSADARR